MPRVRLLLSLGAVCVSIIVGCSGGDGRNEIACGAITPETWRATQLALREDPTSHEQARRFAEKMVACETILGDTNRQAFAWLGKPWLTSTASASWFLGGEEDAEVYSVFWNSKEVIVRSGVFP